MSGSQQLLLGGAPTVPAVDPYFYSVTSLLHGDGTNGGQNNTFLDSSTNNFTITRNGNTTQGSFSPFSQTGWSNYFDGTGDYLSATSNAAFGMGSGDYTIECWLYLTGTPTYHGIYSTTGTTSSDIQIQLQNRLLRLSSYTAQIAIANAGTEVPLNQWTHVAFCRSGTTVRLFNNGIQVGSATDSTTWATGAIQIGQVFGLYPLNGYMSNLRVVKGTAVYTSNFTVPTTPLTAITNTSLLTCQSNRFLDASTNNFTITANGDVSVQPFSPFNPTTAYSTSAVGGSGYFDGSGDYLSVPSNAAFAYGTGALTIEAFINTTTKVDFQSIIGSFDSVGWFLHTTATGVVLAGLNSGTFITGTKNVCDGAWHHVAMVRSGSTLTLYIDGVSDGAISDSTNVSSTTEVRIGGLSAGIPRPLTGYISSLRVVKGTAVYTANFTPPTAPLTAIANTSLLTNFTNGAIFDNAAVADYETVGNAQISTSVKKYGTGSLAFDGTGDRLFVGASSPNLSLRGSDYTVEMWVYPNSYSGFPYLISSGAGGTAWAMYLDTGGALGWGGNTGANQFTAGNVPLSTWTHVAVSQSANVAKWYINGNLVLTKTATDINNANWVATNQISVGSNFGANDFNGYIDDLRISKGVGRYPYNFTPPTAEFPNIGGTVTLTADPYYEYTTLLLPGNGTNGAQNNTFLDSSTNAFTITRNGNTTQGTFSPFSQTGWGNYFDGTGDYLTAPSGASPSGTGTFTVEFWIYPLPIASGYRVIFANGTGGGFAVLIQSAGTISYGRALVAVDGTTTGAVSFNQWNHVALVRSGTGSNQFVVYINGTSAGTFTNSTNYSAGTAYIGIDGNGIDFPVNAYLSNVRVTNTAVYTSNFTPSTTPLTAITNTSLLTCQSNRFIDNSTNNFAITRNGDVSVQAFSPFNPTAAWSAATYGGSGYFDGSGDFLNFTASSVSTSADFTVECWIYPNASIPSNHGIFALSDARFGLITVSGNLYLLTTTGDINTSTALRVYEWSHIAVTRTSNVLRVFLNGVQVGATQSNSQSLSGNWRIASNQSGEIFPACYISGARILIGTGGTSVPVPTAPPTAITNTNFLCNFTNAGIYDATSKNDLETVGNAQISTTQSKFGGSSMYFDGTDDYLFAPSRAITSMSGDFTVEMWIYRNSGNNFFFTVGDSVGSSGFDLYIGNSGANLRLYSGNSVVIDNALTSVSFPTSTWTHVAVVRFSGSVRMYVAGFQAGSAWSSTSTFSGNIHVGAEFYNGSVTGTCNGYMQDVRVTNGIARYTSNFTPPSAAFLTL